MSRASTAKTAKPKIAKTPVTTGWVVKKRFTKMERDPKNENRPAPKSYDKVVSKLFTSVEAANIFLGVAKKFPQVGPGEHDVSYYVTENGGHDDLPPGL